MNHINPKESSLPAAMAELQAKTSDCSQGFCSVYCPQWCFIVQPSPPTFAPPESASSAEFSPFLIAVIGVMAAALLLLLYYSVFSRYFSRSEIPSTLRRVDIPVDWWFSPRDGGLEESQIQSIRVIKFSSEEKMECSDCSICLGEFLGEEILRLLPNCNHAFHVSCVDVWLRSNSTCPLCRRRVVCGGESSTEDEMEAGGGGGEEGRRGVEVMRRSLSVMVASGLEEEESSCGGYAAERRMKRSLSCGRFGFTRHGGWSRNVLPF